MSSCDKVTRFQAFNLRKLALAPASKVTRVVSWPASWRQLLSPSLLATALWSDKRLKLTRQLGCPLLGGTKFTLNEQIYKYRQASVRERHPVSNNSMLALLLQTHPLRQNTLTLQSLVNKISLILTSIFTLLLSPSAIVTDPTSVKFLQRISLYSRRKRTPQRSSTHASFCDFGVTNRRSLDGLNLSQNLRQNQPTGILGYIVLYPLEKQR